ncbi:hypothetical protein DT87_26445 [Streptomyces sp. NTK 937]|nr:hypothetical protein DT87_26445 [Streptomyces sp. NTK 937]
MCGMPLADWAAAAEIRLRGRRRAYLRRGPALLRASRLPVRQHGETFEAGRAVIPELRYVRLLIPSAISPDIHP